MGTRGGWGSSLEPNLPFGREGSSMGYPQPDDFVDRERALFYWGASSLKSHAFEQRKHARVTWRAQMIAQQLCSDSTFSNFKVAAEIVNISEGGMCIACDLPIDAGSVLQCDMKIPGLEVRIPTVMQVVWMAVSDGEKFILGLRYVI